MGARAQAKESVVSDPKASRADAKGEAKVRALCAIADKGIGLLKQCQNLRQGVEMFEHECRESAHHVAECLEAATGQINRTLQDVCAANPAIMFSDYGRNV